jgi:hypothetical protein
MHTPTVQRIAKKFAPPQCEELAVATGDKPNFRPLALESAATASLEQQISALKEISSLLRAQLEETRKDRDAWRTQAEGRFGRRVKGFLGAMTGVLVTILTVFLFDALNTPHSQRIVNWDVAATRLISSTAAIRDALTR